MRSLFAPLAALALLALAPAPAAAHPQHARHHEPAPIGALVGVDVIDRDTGQIAPVYAHGGEYWLAGTPGHRYAVRLRNLGGERVLAVLSVDGVNAVSGQTASAQQTGYVLGPWQQTEVAGWRKSLHDIAQFEFTALPDSYAARTGRPANVGVIGVAVFRERVRHWYGHEDAISKQAAPAASAPRAAAESSRDATGAAVGARRAQPQLGAIAPPASPKLGTGPGAREWSQARQVSFERESATPFEVIALRYDSERNLVAMGVIPPPRHPRHPSPQPHQPEPFPIGFVPDPHW